MQDKIELAVQYGIDVSALDFSMDDFTVEELTKKFESMKASADAEPQAAAEPEQKFALTENIMKELRHALYAVKVKRDWGESTQYEYADCDMDASEVYCWDTTDWLLYGFTYSTNGDSVAIDFNSKKRKKYVIADFDEGEQASPFVTMFTSLEQKIQDGIQWKEKYDEASSTISAMEAELVDLRKFKADAESVAAESARKAVFAKFEDLAGIEAFEALRENCAECDVEALEEKCYAIRGRNGSVARFSLENKVPKLKVDKTEIVNEPYGGIFTQYGIEPNN